VLSVTDPSRPELDSRPAAPASSTAAIADRTAGWAPPLGTPVSLALQTQASAGNVALTRALESRPRAGSRLDRCPDGSDPDCPCHDEERAQDAEDADLGRALAGVGRERGLRSHASPVIARQGPDTQPPGTGETSPASHGGGLPASGLATPGCTFPIEDVTLFDALQKTWPLFGESTEVTVWEGTADLGWLGWIEFSVLAGAEAEASLFTSLGPGMLRNICLDADPSNASVTGTATLSIPADATPDLRLAGSLRGSADYLGRVPLAALGGALETLATANARPEVAVTVKLGYTDGRVSLTAAADVSLALKLMFDLNASLLAELFGEEVWSGSWNLASWEWSRVWNVIGRLSVAMSDGVASEPRLELMADQLSMKEVLSSLFADLIDADEIVGGIRGSSVANEVKLLDPMTDVVARASIQAEDYATALEAVVHDLPIDTSICTIEYVPSSAQDGLTEAEFDKNNKPTSIRVSIFTPAFSSVPWLVSIVMHEYQHVRQFQQGLEPAEFEGSKQAGAVAEEAREVEAYLWQLEHAEETALDDKISDLEEIERRLEDHYDALGQLDPKRQRTYKARVEAALGSAHALAMYRCERKCQLVTVEGAEAVGYVVGIGHGNTVEKAHADCQRDANRQADEYNRNNPDKKRVRARHCSNVRKCEKVG